MGKLEPRSCSNPTLLGGTTNYVAEGVQGVPQRKACFGGVGLPSSGISREEKRIELPRLFSFVPSPLLKLFSEFRVQSR